MSTQDNKALARRLIEEAWNQGNLATVDELMAPDHVGHHSLVPNQPPSRVVPLFRTHASSSRAEEIAMKKSKLRPSGQLLTRLFRPNAVKSAAERALLQAKREKRFSTHDEEHFLGRDMVARWKAHRLWG